jgi:hypothetical protein
MKSVAIVLLSFGFAACAYAPKPPLVVKIAAVSDPVGPWLPLQRTAAATVAVTVRNATSEPLHVMSVKVSSNLHSLIAFDETVAAGASATRSFRVTQVWDQSGGVSLGGKTYVTTTYTRPGENTPRASRYVFFAR